jgi:putative transposase
MVRGRKLPSPSWRAFLDNHVKDLVAIDFFTVPTATFGVLFGFMVLAHDRRRVLHFNVTANPTAEWTARQVVQAFPEETVPRYLVRDRDRIYGGRFRRMLEILRVEEVVTAARSPWQNAYAERLIGSLRRECLDHVVILGEIHLLRILAGYFEYYNRARCHLSLAGDAPELRPAQGPELGRLNSAGWLSCPRLAGCIIDTSAPRRDAVAQRKGRGATAPARVFAARGA